MASATHKVDISWDRRPAGVVVHVVFDNARRLNVLNPPALLDLTEAFQSLAREDDIRVVVFSGAGGKAFIGGADINHMVTMRSSEDGRAFITLIHKLCQSIRDCPVPVICRAEGYTLGAGLEVAAACDMRIAADNAFFGMPEVKVGIPSVVEAALLPRLIGWGRTSRMLLTAENINAAKAEAWGLVEEVGGLDALAPYPGRPEPEMFSKLHFAERHLFKLTLLDNVMKLSAMAAAALLFAMVLPRMTQSRRDFQDVTLVPQIGAVAAS